MPVSFSDRKITICTCLYGNYPALAKRVIGSIMAHCDRSKFYLRVGCNMVCDETYEFVNSIKNDIDDIYICKHNLNKDPMYKRMIFDMETKYHFWFDDDSAIEMPDTLNVYLEKAESSDDKVAMWGKLEYVDSMASHINKNYKEIKNPEEIAIYAYKWIRSQKWYKGGPVPSGRFKLGDMKKDYIRQEFLIGSAYFARTHVIKDVLEWPAKGMSKVLDDILLSEAVKQSGYEIYDMKGYGIMMNACSRRGDGEDYEAFKYLFN